MPKVSVVIPVYNVEKYLPKCLESVINQTYKDLEVICVNDGTKDSSMEILKEYAQKDSRIKIINKENGGLSSARNAGLDVASGAYCYFLDSDDWIESNTIEKLVNIITKNDVDVVVHSALNIAEDESCKKIADDCNNWFESYKKEDGIYEVPVEIYTKIPTVTWNKLYKMSIINKYNCRFPEGLINEDELFIWTYMIHCKDYYYLNEKLYNYLRRSSSIMGTRDNTSKVLDILEIEKELYNTVKKYKNIGEYQECLTQNYINKINSLFQRMPKKYRKEALKKIKEYYKTTNRDKRILKLYRKYKYKKIKQFIQAIFSITNIITDKYVGKQLMLLGIKLKFKNKVETLRRELLYQIKVNTEAENNKIDLIKSNINAKYFSEVNNGLNIVGKKDYSKTAVLFKYDYFLGVNNLEHFGVNLGDYVQTIATKNIIQTISPDVDFVYWDRDNLLHYKGQKAYSIMQGWFSHSDAYLPNENILPIFIGTHITTAKRNQFINLVKHNPGYFDNITFGCRDTSTLNFLKNIGQKSYLSRCLTLTFPKRQNLPTQNKVFIVDIPDEYLKYIPSHLVKNAKFIYQRSVDVNNDSAFYINSEKKYMVMAEQLLNNYKNNASLVITSALHCASPCIAMGIPTVLIDFENKNDRFGSLKGFFKIYKKEDLINGRIDYQPISVDIEELKQLMIKNVEISIKQAFDEKIDINELNSVREKIGNYCSCDIKEVVNV